MAEEVKNTAEGAEQSAEKTYTEAEYAALQTQLGDVQKQLDEANTTIRSYTDMDIEGIKQSAADWQKKAEAAENERAAFEYRTKLSQYVRGLHLKDDIYEAHVVKLLEEKGLKFDGDKLIGGDDIIGAFREAHPGAFADTKPKPEFVDSTPGNTKTSPDDDYIRKVMGLK